MSTANRVRGCGRPNPSTGGVGDPKFFLNWLTSASKPYDADHISTVRVSNFTHPGDSSVAEPSHPAYIYLEKILPLINRLQTKEKHREDLDI